MSWETQIGRLPEAEMEPHLCQGADCKIVHAPYLARTEWLSMGVPPPAQSPRFGRFCVNCAAKLAGALKLPFPPGYWKAGKLGRPPLVFEIPEGTPMATCESCRDNVRWIVTRNGKRMPCNEDGTSHFTTCPNAAQHRKAR
jgi:hypothetical protein